MGVRTRVTELASAMVQDVTAHHGFGLGILWFGSFGALFTAHLGLSFNNTAVMLQFRGEVRPNGISITILGGYLRIYGGLIEVFWLAFFDKFSSIRTRGPFLDVKEFKL